MIDYWPLIITAVAGAALGLFFYGGLYFTVVRGMSSTRPALWFISSLLIRTIVVLLALYYISAGQWQRLLVCMGGFMLVGIVFKIWKSIPAATAASPHHS